MNLSGPIPPQLALLQELQYLDLSNNKLTGCIWSDHDHTLFSLPLEELYLHNNNFTFSDPSVLIPLKRKLGPNFKADYCSAAYALYDHCWDFREAKTNPHNSREVVDECSNLRALIKGGATLTPSGLVLQGDGYVDIENWKWGATTSIEVLVYYSSFSPLASTVFCFNDDSSNEGLFMCDHNSDGVPRMYCYVDR